MQLWDRERPCQRTQVLCVSARPGPKNSKSARKRCAPSRPGTPEGEAETVLYGHRPHLRLAVCLSRLLSGYIYSDVDDKPLECPFIFLVYDL